jgi:D-3-phosphoglycerate dehydrogenase
MDNIDVDYARSRGIHVINTPAASSRSVAELCFAHMLGLTRFLHLSNREMPSEGKSGFEALKKKYAAGTELYGKTLGIIGLGRIGSALASIGFGMGMDVLAYDPMVSEAEIFFGPEKHRSKTTIASTSLQDLLINSDFISIHVPSLGKPLISMTELKMMKNDAILINASRGGIVDEHDLLEALDHGIIRGAGLDVFTGEPLPNEHLLNHPRISVSPHTGASTIEAQNNVGKELAEQLINILK